MKKIALFLLCVMTLTACKKEPLPGDKLLFAGLWLPKTPVEGEIYELEILPNGSGRYHQEKPGSTLDAQGNVYFKSANLFTIGGRIIKKKFKVDKPPVKIIESMQPFKFRVEMTVNGVEYLRAEER